MTEPMHWDPPEIMVPRNRRLIAERTGWPEGALDEVLKVEEEHPGWDVWWAPENTSPGFENPTGFHAKLDESYPRAHLRVFSPTLDGLCEEIAAATASRGSSDGWR